MPKNTIIAISTLILVALVVTFAWLWNHSPQSLPDENVISSAGLRHSDVASASSQQGDLTLADLYSEIIKIRTDLDSMKEAVSEIQQGQGDSSDVARLKAESPPDNLKELFQYFMDDPDGVSVKLAPYFTEQQLDVVQQTDNFFAELPDTDPSWNAESQIFINESISNSALQSIATTQVNEVTCKGGICKVDISLTSNNGQAFSEEELFEAENRLLITLSKDFPNSRLQQTEKDGQISFQGYVSDGTTKLPENQIDFNNPAVIEQIHSILK